MFGAEIILILCILICQTLIGLYVIYKSASLAGLIPEEKKLGIKKSKIGNLEKDSEKYSTIELAELQYTGKVQNAFFSKILGKINEYLKTNAAGTVDLEFIKEIIERETNTKEQAIEKHLATTLYLGLIGTILGIIFGLINIYKNATTAEFDLNPFLFAVAIAMTASAYGLLWTVINSNFVYNGAQLKLSQYKNDFYTFMQIKLLPIVGKNFTSSVVQLNHSFADFNNNFNSNIQSLTKILTKNYDAVIAQEKILSKLENLDVVQLAKTNINVLAQLEKGTRNLEEFNNYIYWLQTSAKKISKTAKSFDAILERTNNFSELASKIDERIEQSNGLLLFLGSHFAELDDSSRIVKKTVQQVDDTLVEALDNLQEHTNEKILWIRKQSLAQQDAINEELAQGGTSLSSLNKLNDVNGNLEKLVQMANMSQNTSVGIIDKLDELIAENTRLQEVQLDLLKKGLINKLNNWWKQVFKKL